MSRVGAYTPDVARLILATVQYLRQSGFVIQASGANIRNSGQGDSIHVRNDSGEEVPAFACMQVTGAVDVGGQNYITIDKAADVTGTAGWYLFNSIAPIEIDGYGIANDGPLARILTNGTAVTCGDKWAPTVNQWYISPSDSGIISAVGEDDIETNVMRGVLMGIPGCINPVVDVYLDGLSLKQQFCDGTIETIFTGTECP